MRVPLSRKASPKPNAKCVPDGVPMTPSRPYLLRAINEWILDNDLTPFILVDAEQDGVIVPGQFVENGKIVLNINPQAIQGLTISNNAVNFSARFQGTPWDIHIPIQAVLAIYTKENGRGMMFTEEDGGGDEPPTDSPDSDNKSRPTLKVVK